MAQMPRGAPRSVPDPAGEDYDAMIRRGKLEKHRAAAARSPLFIDTTPFTPSDRLDAVRHAPRSDSTVTVGGRTYREIDNGHANVLVPIIDPLHSPAERAAQRDASGRASFMASHPLAGAAYGIASLFNASPGVRDGALAAGGVLDAAMLGAAPRGAPIRSPLTAPQKQPLPPTFQRPDVRFGDLTANRQASGVAATITAPMLGKGTRVRWDPPGWRGDGDVFGEARAHLLGSQFRGSGRDRRNAVTLTREANMPKMSTFENRIARRARAGEVVEYAVKPLYADGVLPPSAVLLTAHGTRGAPTALYIKNSGGLPP